MSTAPKHLWKNHGPRLNSFAEQHKTQVWYYTCDITDEDAVGVLFETAMAKTRYPLRGLVTCAGISGGGPTVDFPVEKVRRIMEINVMGTFICAQAAARGMRKCDVTGSMVFVASMSAHGSNKVRMATLNP